MISLQNYIVETLKSVKLPYTFDIYNEGQKNKDYQITKANIYNTYFSIARDSGKTYNTMIELPLCAKEINYKECPNKDNTDNWSKVPEIRQWTYAGSWYSSKWREYNKEKYDKDWNTWLRSLKPYMKGKISVTIDETEDKHLRITVNNEQFNKERKERIDELENVNNIKKLGEEITNKEKEEIEKIEKEEKEKQEQIKKYYDFLNSMSEKERLEYLRQQDRDNELTPKLWKGHWTGD